MTVRLNVLFNGSPDESEQTFREVVGMGYERIPFSRFVRWRLASKSADIWSMDIDVLPLDRPRVIYLLTPLSVSNEDVEASMRDITHANGLPLRLMGEETLSETQRIEMKHNCVDVCDRVFVVNSNETIDDETQSIIDIATDTGKKVSYLKY